MKIRHFCSLATSLLLYMHSCPLEASIVKTNTIQTVAEQADTQSLVLFNITNTLYRSETAMGDSIWKDFFSERVRALIPDRNRAEQLINQTKNKIINAVPKTLVEPSTAKVIADLQAKKIPVVGFTMKSPVTAYEGNFAELVNSYLNTLGIYLATTNQFLTVSANSDNAYDYLYGILFTSKKPKDVALLSFINHLDTKPKKILMVDINQNNLESTEKSLAGSPFTFVGFQYSNENNRDSEFDKDIGTIEFRDFLTTGQIISDQEAMQIKHHNPSMNYTAILDDLILKLAGNP